MHATIPSFMIELIHYRFSLYSVFLSRVLQRDMWAQVVSLGEEVKRLQSKPRNDGILARAQELASRNSELAKVNSELRAKLSSALVLLRRCQQQALGKPASDSLNATFANLPDVDTFTASCESMDVQVSDHTFNGFGAASEGVENTGLDAGTQGLASDLQDGPDAGSAGANSTSKVRQTSSLVIPSSSPPS
jgi:hypothetical protein